eukprot:NODE_110_length_18645_cov_0.794403.p3 type:complete len:462 gc:universal NODE_110_length_18645_cov_0.794403:6903-8288(+)
MFDIIFDFLAAKTGLATSALRLLVGMLLGYPAAYFYTKIIDSAKTLRLSYLLTTGLGVAYIFCQEDIVYSLAAIFFTWSTCFVFQKLRSLALLTSFVGNVGSLLYIYYLHSTDDYDLNWTTCQSVLCLRLIGFTYDFYDGTDKNYKGSANGSLPWVGDLSLKELPNILEVFGYCYFFSGFLVGPQFSFKHYSLFLENKFYEETKSKNLKQQYIANAYKYAWKSLAIGVLYLGWSQVLNIIAPAATVLDHAYLKAPIWKKLLLIFVCGKRAFTKYYGVWKLNEGPCALSGLSYNGIEKENVKMDGLCNINPFKLELGTSLGFQIENFNINTNQWLKLYVFKRLRFLNNKNLSSVGALFFLAVWHGFHVGYYLTFLYEFLIVGLEAQFLRITAGSSSNILTSLIGWIHTNFNLFFPVIAFDVLSIDKIRTAYDPLYWIPFIYAALGFVLLPMVPPLYKSDKLK